MSRYALEEVVQKWAKEDLTVEQAIGQLFLHVENVIERLTFLEKKEKERGKADEEDNGQS